jgi:hypothetical protein
MKLSQRRSFSSRFISGTFTRLPLERPVSFGVRQLDGPSGVGARCHILVSIGSFEYLLAFEMHYHIS